MANQNPGENCIFCRIAVGTIPARLLYQDDQMLAFADISPQAPVHFLVIPRKHIESLMDAEESDGELLGRMLWRAQKIAVEQNLGVKGARFVINCKSHGGQTVDHLHLHVLGGRALHWPPG